MLEKLKDKRFLIVLLMTFLATMAFLIVVNVIISVSLGASVLIGLIIGVALYFIFQKTFPIDYDEIV